jgi:hypothetical protein
VTISQICAILGRQLVVLSRANIFVKFVCSNEKTSFLYNNILLCFKTPGRNETPHVSILPERNETPHVSIPLKEID